MTELSPKIVDQYQTAYDELQGRFGGQIKIVESDAGLTYQDPSQFLKQEAAAGFYDISAKVGDLGPFIGRVVLYPNRQKSQYQPAVITQKGNSLQMTVLDQPFDPKIGITEGILFGLGLKNDTRLPGFGAHTTSGGFEAGHFAPAMIAARLKDARDAIINHGDNGTHSIGSDVGGVPEKMLQEKLLDGVAMRTKDIPINSPHTLALYWHPTLEDGNGLMAAEYRGSTSAVKLMLGAASQALGERSVEQIGDLVNAAVKGN